MHPDVPSTIAETIDRSVNAIGPRSDQGDDSELQVDLTKYRTPELCDRLTELISVPEAIRKILVATTIVAVLCVLAGLLILDAADLTLIPWLAASAYSLAVGVILGLLLGALRIIGAGLRNVESILDIVLEISRHAAIDHQRLQTGQAILPSGGELVERVYDDVVSPAMEKAVARVFGVLGTPLLWAYRRSVGTAVRFLIKRVSRTQLMAKDEQQIRDQAAKGLASIACYSETIGNFTTRAAELVRETGRGLRVYAMTPLSIAFLVALVLAMVPLYIVRHYFGG